MKAARENFRAGMPELAANNLVFLDEFGANLGMVPRHGRARAGRRVHINKPASRGRNITFAGAMTVAGLLVLEALPGTANKVRFLAWVRDILCPRLREGHVVVMDNLSAHHADEVRQAIEGRGAQILFLPPYSPDLNPIEECWSKVKNYLRKQMARTEPALLAAVARAMDQVTANDASGWFLHAGYDA